MLLILALLPGALAERQAGGGIRPISPEGVIPLNRVSRQSRGAEEEPAEDEPEEIILDVDGPEHCVTGETYTWEVKDSYDGITMAMAVYDGTFEDPETPDVMLQGAENVNDLTYTFYLPGDYVLFIEFTLDGEHKEYFFTSTLRTAVRTR